MAAEPIPDGLSIVAEQVSKKFARRLRRALWYAACDTVAELTGASGRERDLRPQEFWALDRVSLAVAPGHGLAVIGRNGAGKSTLLKLLAGLLRPDRGKIRMRGRIVSLLAPGAGCNAILTGRENIFLLAALHGVSSRTVRPRLEEIVAFAELEDHIDMPVGGYSQGMRVRLGFAVAAALQPEVLLLDDVLAVVDSAFRQKCAMRIRALQARTAVVLASHSPEEVASTATEVLWLESGRVAFWGLPQAALARYGASAQANGDRRRVVSPAGSC